RDPGLDCRGLLSSTGSLAALGMTVKGKRATARRDPLRVTLPWESFRGAPLGVTPSSALRSHPKERSDEGSRTRLPRSPVESGVTGDASLGMTVKGKRATFLEKRPLMRRLLNDGLPPRIIG